MVPIYRLDSISSFLQGSTSTVEFHGQPARFGPSAWGGPSCSLSSTVHREAVYWGLAATWTSLANLHVLAGPSFMAFYYWLCCFLIPGFFFLVSALLFLLRIHVHAMYRVAGYKY